jgi:hypothetical protein
MEQLLTNFLKSLPVHHELTVEGITYTKRVQLCCGCTDYVWKGNGLTLYDDELADIFIEAAEND